MQRPHESDFKVTLLDGGVHVLFGPTESQYEFRFLADPRDIARFGPLSQDVTVRHSKTGDTGDYAAADVLAMAQRLAEREARGNGRPKA